MIVVRAPKPKPKPKANLIFSSKKYENSQACYQIL